jgi:DNA damage-inducible DNA polymerase II (EC 2.7.7.7)
VLDKKVDDVDNRVAEIVHNFHHDKLALAQYNLQDCKLVYDIFEHTQLLDFATLRAELTGLSVDRIGGSVAAFTNLYLPKLHRHGYVAPNMGDGMKGLVSPGGYVMDSIPGLYRNVLVLDFKSLYPSIIRTFNVDPVGMVEGLKSPDDAIQGFDGAYFSREHHFLPAIIKELWQERDKAKREHNPPLSQAIKIIMNSFYGILGSTGCRFFDPRLSGSITKRSHEILKRTKVWIESLGHKVIYGDTDSIFVAVGEALSLTQCKTLGDDLQQYINDKWHSEINENYQTKCYLEIEFETHFSQFFIAGGTGRCARYSTRWAV